MDDISDAAPIIAFIAVATIIMILIFLSRKRCMLLWKSTLMSFIFSLPGPILWYIGMSLQIEKEGISADFLFIIFNLLFILLVIPGMFIYGLIPRVIKPCPSDLDLFGWLTFGFLFYVLVFWGRNKFRKYREEMKVAEKTQNDNMEKQTPTETKT
jgi:hypothetical protein